MSTESTDPTAAQGIDHTRWRIDPSRSRLEFHAPNFWGLSTVKGRFERYEGTLDLSRQPPIELTIDADSLETHNKRRDRHLRSADFFDVANHPQVRYVGREATLQGEQLEVRGQLEAAGNSVPLDLTATLRRVGEELEVEAATHVNRHHLGMTWDRLGMLRGPSKLIVHGRLVRDA